MNYKTALRICVGILLLAVVIIGCQRNATTSNGQSSGAQNKEYEIKGTVVAIGEDKKSVTLDHEEIPNLMKAMKMDYQVQNPQVVAELKTGDRVHGHLKVDGGEYIITDLEVVANE